MHTISKFRISREFPGIPGSEDFYSRFPGVKKCNGSVISRQRAVIQELVETRSTTKLTNGRMQTNQFQNLKELKNKVTILQTLKTRIGDIVPSPIPHDALVTINNINSSSPIYFYCAPS